MAITEVRVLSGTFLVTFNVIVNNYKGPDYLNTYDSKGRVTSQLVIGLSVYSPDFRQAAPCKDSHKVIHLQLAFYREWWVGVIAENP